MHMHIGQQILYLLFRQKGKLLQLFAGSRVQVQLLFHPSGKLFQLVFPVGALGLGGQLLQVFLPEHQVGSLCLQGQSKQGQHPSDGYSDVFHSIVICLWPSKLP